ncbi:MAG: FAD binding domain-containing protein, partial [Candidatus Rokubacteria bacterium]|nr:FAD binding domain-containing protein [Candidatus Rokubacteria bacterium]
SLISLHRIPQLKGIGSSPEGASIGAMATYRAVRASPLVREKYGILAQASGLVGPIPVQNEGTVVGSTCHNAPGADVPPALLALDATAKAVGPRGERSIPLASYFTGFIETALAPDELLVAITLPPPPRHVRGAYVKFNYRLIDLALVGAAVVLALDKEKKCHLVRVALGGVSNTPVRAYAAERILEGQPLTQEAIAEAARVAAEGHELLSDVHCSAAYRRKVIPPVVRRAFQQALSSGNGLAA